MKKPFTVLFLFGLLIFSGCRENYNAEKLYWKANKVLAGVTKAQLKAQGPQVLEPAVQAYQAVFEKYPSTPKAADSLFVIANLRLKQKKFDDAVKVLQTVVTNYSRMQDKPAEARYGIAEIYEANGDWPKAEAMFWELAEYHPLHSKGGYSPVHIVIHYKKTKNPEAQKQAAEKAIAYYDKMMKQLGPIEASASLSNNKALVYLAQGEWKEARKIWLGMAEQFPDNPYTATAVLAAAELSWKKGELSTAIAEYSSFLEKYPKHPMSGNVMMQLGNVYDANKEYAKAREWFQKAMDLLKDPAQISDMRLLIARSYQNEGKWPDALKIYDEIENKNQYTSAALQIPLLKAMHYQEIGEKDTAANVLAGAIAKYQNVIDTNPQASQYAQRLQNAALAETGDWKRMLKNFDANISKEKSTVKKGEWLFLKAVVFENRLKDNAQAINLYKDFLAQYPDHPLTKLAKSRIEVLQTT